MLQLKEEKLICELCALGGLPLAPYELKPVKFGYSRLWETGAAVILASQEIPENVALLVTRVQCYAVDISDADAGFLVYRTFPEGLAWWILARSVSTTALINATNPSAPGHLPLDCDEMLIFPSPWYANLIFDPASAPPAVGTFQLRTTVFGYLVPPRVYEVLGGPVDWINVQQ